MNYVRWIFYSLTSLVIINSAYGQTAEIDQAKRDYENQRRIADRVKDAYEDAQRDTRDQLQVYTREKGEYDRVKRDYDNAVSTVRREEQNISTYDRQISSAQSTIRNSESEKNRLLSKRRQLDNDQDRVAREIQRLSSDINDLTRRIASAQQAGNETLATRLIAQKRTKLSERSRKQSEQQSISSQLRQNRNDLDRANRAISTAENNIQTYQRQRTRAEQDLADARRRQNNLEPRLSRERLDMQRELRELSDLQSVEADLRRDYQREDRLADQKYDEFQRLLREYEEERLDAITLGQTSGRTHGQNEARRRGDTDGSRSGTTAGRVAGEDDARFDISQRDYVKGYRDGYQSATSVDLSLSYSQGIAAGQSIAKDKAVAEDFPVGFNTALSSLMNQEPQERETIDISENISDASGDSSLDLRTTKKKVGSVLPPNVTMPLDPVLLPPRISSASVAAPSPDNSEYRSPCNQVRFEFRAACGQAYAQSYRSGFNSDYRGFYERSYVQNYNNAAALSHSQTVSGSEDRQAFERGRQEGAKDRGKEDGFSNDYARVSSEHKAMGQSEFDRIKSNGFLIKFHSTRLLDQNGDGLLSGGETLKVELVVDNLGYASSAIKLLQFKVGDLSGISEVNYTIRDLPSFKSNTRTTLTGVITAKVSQNVALSELKLSAILESTSGEVVKSIEILDTVKFPVQLTNVSSQSELSVGSDSEIVLTYKNMTTEALSGGTLILKSVGDVLDFKEDIEIADLAAGESVDIPVLVGVGSEVNDVSQIDLLSKALSEFTQNFETSLKIARDAEIRVYNNQGTRLPRSISVDAGRPFEILADMKYLSTLPRIGPMELKVVSKSAGIMFGNNSTVGVNYGTIASGTQVGKSTFRFQTQSSMSGQEGEIVFELTNSRELTHRVRLRVSFK